MTFDSNEAVDVVEFNGREGFNHEWTRINTNDGRGLEIGKSGGAMGIRTPDLLIANETLYQLSYDPTRVDRV